MIDYLIVGSGIAGICFAETALQNNKSILVFDNNSQNSSKIAAGIYNPVILKRFSQVWNATEQLEYLNDFYPKIEQRIQTKIDYKISILRKFYNIQEQNDWFTASDKPHLAPFLSSELFRQKFKSIQSPFDYVEVVHTGYVNTSVMLQQFQEFLSSNNLLLKQSFDFEKLLLNDHFLSYNDIKAKHIIFAEGFGLHSNKYFNNLPLDGTKGEILVIKAPNLNLNCIINSSIYIVPLGNNLFKVGATYHWDDKTNQPTEQGKQELIDKIKELLDCDFEIMEHVAGVRPTVKDRKPLVGTHAIYKNLHILNGLGTRGVMLGPSLARDLYDNIENNKPINIHIDIKRFVKNK